MKTATDVQKHPLLKFVDLTESVEAGRTRERAKHMPPLYEMSEQDLREECAYWRGAAVGVKERRRNEREAYRWGFIAALNKLSDLRRMGFVRETERVGMLDQYAETLKPWVFGPSGSDCHTAPPIRWSSWWDIRKLVFDRDGTVCEHCGATEALQVDHINPVCRGGLPTLSNLRVLCKTCNLARNSKSGAAA